MTTRKALPRSWLLGSGRYVMPAMLAMWMMMGHVQGKPAETDAAAEQAGLESFQIEQVPDDENAWLILQKAAQATQTGVDSPASSNLTYPPYPPYGDEWLAMARESEAAHVEAFRLAREARSLPRSMVRSELPASPDDLGLRSYNPIRQLANLLGDSALYCYVQGNDAESIERLLDLLHLAKSLRADPLLVSQLVAIGIDALATHRTQVIAGGLRFGAEQIANPPIEQVRALIRTLLDDDDFQERMRQTLYAEHALLSLRADGPGDIPQPQRALLEATLAVTVDALARGNLPDTLNRLKDRPMPNLGVSDQLFIAYYRTIGDRRMAAVSVAAQLYRADHGVWPETLDQLVPDYLPDLPRDPFRNDGQAIGYVIVKDGLPDGRDRPLVYVDSGDAEDAISDKPMYGWQTDPRVETGARRRPDIRQYRDLADWQLLHPRPDGGGGL